MYLLDLSALWRMQREPAVLEHWRATIEAGELRSCAPQRVEVLRSARNATEFDQMSRDLTLFYPDASVPKNVWRWIDTAQHTLVRAGALRAFSVVDLVICGTSVHHGLTVLHDDRDFDTAARHLTDMRSQRVRSG
ncbi:MULTISPECIES: PIN domain-containing protein [Gordonia]|nr:MULTISPECIES: PIN domain-containing protein [Gordonia]